jgi:phosphatidylserine/phosphatidylglycerophosphate/cardiolipin synthase-like enzyme
MALKYTPKLQPQQLTRSCIRFLTESSTTTRQTTTILSPQRKKLMNIVRGLNDDNYIHNNSNHSSEKRILKCFPLRESNFPSIFEHQKYNFLSTPNEFHQILCQKIRSAQKRIYVASLYVGPAAEEINNTNEKEYGNINHAYPKERELLQALEESAAKRDHEGNRIVNIKILLDHNRALRPVSIISNNPMATKNSKSSTVTSASACYQCLHPDDISYSNKTVDPMNPATDSGVYLISVLSPWLQQILPNPYNEIAGVFHIKCYIFDNDMIISGANLSEEYFADRTDRYLWITDDDYVNHIKGPLNEIEDNAYQLNNNSGQHQIQVRNNKDKANNICNMARYKKGKNNSGLVQCYADVIQSICEHAEVYTEDKTRKHSDIDKTQNMLSFSLSTTRSSDFNYSPRTSKQHLLQSLTNILTVPSREVNNDIHDDDDSIIAYAIPTFQFPKSFLNEFRNIPNSNTIPSDVDVICNLIRYSNRTSYAINDSRQAEKSTSINQGICHIQNETGLRLATAYCNPTMSFLRAIRDVSKIHFISAGKLSHGFRPKKSTTTTSHGTKNKRKTDFIPAIFDNLSRHAVSTLRLWKELDANRNVIKSNSSDDITNNYDPVNSIIQLWYYQRLDWTFHAKGIWLTQDESKNLTNTSKKRRVDDCVTLCKSSEVNNSATVKVVESANILTQENHSVLIKDPSTLCAVTNGSSNYGSRSDLYDMESNLVLIFPDYPMNSDQKQIRTIKGINQCNKETIEINNHVLKRNRCQELFCDEWNRICQFVEPCENEKVLPLSRFWKTLLPWVRPYF